MKRELRAAALLLACGAAAAAQTPDTARRPAGAAKARPVVGLVATGGTISNTGGAQRLTGQDIARSVPGLDTLAALQVEQFSNLASGSVTPAHWLGLARRINELFRAQPELRGVVVTHGTDTLEETAYFLDLTIAECRPVVVTGAMRRATDVGAEGPANLLNSVRTLLAPAAAGRGTLVLLNDEIFAAREVSKVNTSRLDAFVAPGTGPAGVADPDRVTFTRPAPPRRCGEPAFDLAGVSELPRVEIVYSYIGADSVPIEAAVRAGARGIVVAGVGRGGMTPVQSRALQRAAAAGVAVVVSSRTGGGRVPADRREARGTVGAADLNPQKARVLLMLALARGGGPAQAVAAFERADRPAMP